MLAIFILFLLSSTLMFFLHCMLNIFVKLMRWLLHSTIHQVMWYFWVFIVNSFALLRNFFFSRKLCFLWSPCFLLIAESIGLDTSDKPTVGFFLKITFPFWIILNNVVNVTWWTWFDWLLKSWWWIFLKKKLFYCCKRFLYGKKWVFWEFIWILFFEFYC